MGIVRRTSSSPDLATWLLLVAVAIPVAGCGGGPYSEVGSIRIGEIRDSNREQPTDSDPARSPEERAELGQRPR